MDLNQIMPVAIPAVTGGLAGGLVSWRVAIHLNRKQIALDVAKDYLSRFKELDEVKRLLNPPAALAGEGELTRVFALGNWFELAASLYLYKIANRKILRRVRMDNEIKIFRDCVARAGGDLVRTLNEDWPHIKSFPKRPSRRQI